MSQLIFHARSLVHLPEALYHYRKDNPDSFCAQDRARRHIASSVNMLDLYGHYRDKLQGSPVEQVADGILLRAGWHCLAHKHDLFAQFPFLAQDIRKARLSRRYRLSIPAQLLVKAYVLFRRK